MKAIQLLGIFALCIAGCGETLQGGLDEPEANEILLVLAEAGIQADKQNQGKGSDMCWQVTVARTDLARAWRTLRAAGLPRTRHAGFRTAYKERALVPGKIEERAIFLDALQEEIAQTLESVQDIVSARVHATLKPDIRFAPGAGSPITAAVLICYRPGPSGELPLSEDEVTKIVANAVTGLEPGQVAVVFTPKRETILPSPEPGTSRENAGVIRKAAAGACALMILAVLVWVIARKWHFLIGLVGKGRTT